MGGDPKLPFGKRVHAHDLRLTAQPHAVCLDDRIGKAGNKLDRGLRGNAFPHGKKHSLSAEVDSLPGKLIDAAISHTYWHAGGSTHAGAQFTSRLWQLY